MENKDSNISWQEKAVSRSIVIKEKNKIIKEKEKSRDHWKEKYMVEKKNKEKYKKEIEIIKKKLKIILSS